MLLKFGFRESLVLWLWGCLFICANGMVSGACQPKYLFTSEYRSDARLLLEHTSVLLGWSSVASDTLTFELLLTDKDQRRVFDSILVGGIAVHPQITDSSIVVVVPPLQDSLSPTLIDFYYRFHYEDDNAMSLLRFPRSLTYFEQFPRLICPDTANTPLAGKYPPLNQFRGTIRIPRDMELLAPFAPTEIIADSMMVEYVLPEFSSQYLMWMVVSKDYCKDTVLAGLSITITDEPGYQTTDSELALIDSTLRSYQALFGELPFSNVNILHTSLPHYLGGETLGNFVFLESGLSIRPDRLMKGAVDSRIVFHELAHLWWGSTVMTDDWLGEGLATYWGNHMAHLLHRDSAILFTEDNIGALRYRWSYRTSGSYAEQNKAVFGYFKGGRVVAMLGFETGADTLAAILKQLYAERAGAFAGIKELRQAAVEIGGIRLNHFFETWTDSCFHQNFRIAAVSSQKHDLCYQNSVRLEHEGRAWSPVPLVVRYADLSEDTLVIPVGQLTYSGQSHTKMKSVEIDPKKQILEDKRTDNAWPIKLKVRRPSLNPIGLFGNLLEYMFSDQPYYQILATPDVPRHSYRFGWSLGVAVLGKRESWFGDLNRGRHLANVRAGYGLRNSEWQYSATYANQLALRDRWGACYRVFAEKRDGRDDLGLAVSITHWVDMLGRNSWESSLAMRQRRYYRLGHVSRDIWPDGRSTLVSLDLSFQDGINGRKRFAGISGSLHHESGLPIVTGYRVYQKTALRLQSSFRSITGGVYLGKTHGSAFQERFDLSLEGNMRGLEGFRFFSSEVADMWLRANWSLYSVFALRPFVNYVCSNTSQPVWEIGIGLSAALPSDAVIGIPLAIAIDVPFYSAGPPDHSAHFAVRQIMVFVGVSIGNENGHDSEFRIRTD
jgi:hypothetical protein